MFAESISNNFFIPYIFLHYKYFFFYILFTFSITSWNEWGEGTQIEPASTSAQIDQHIHNLDSDFKSQTRKIYKRYPQEDPFFYTNLTKTYSAKFNQDKSATSNSQPQVSPEISAPQSFVKESTNNVKIRKNNGILEYL